MKVAVLLGDPRQTHAATELSRLGYSVTPVEEAEWAGGNLPLSADLLLLPTPATGDGVHLRCSLTSPPTLDSLLSGGPSRIFGGGFSAETIRRARHRGQEITDLLSIPAYVEENAALTAEAALGVGMEAAGKSLRGLEVGVVGYGRIASRLTRLLCLLGARVRVFARREEKRLEATLDGATAYDMAALRRCLAPVRLLYNTVPAPCLTPYTTALLSDCAVVELASGKENVALSDSLTGVTLRLAHSLPGKIFPVSAGRIIAHTLDSTLKSEGHHTL